MPLKELENISGNKLILVQDIYNHFYQIKILLLIKLLFKPLVFKIVQILNLIILNSHQAIQLMQF